MSDPASRTKGKAMKWWIFYVAPWPSWRLILSSTPSYWNASRVGIFRNRKGIVPGRWGFYVLGFEVGSRRPGDRFGMWLKRVGLWPW